MIEVMHPFGKATHTNGTWRGPAKLKTLLADATRVAELEQGHIHRPSPDTMARIAAAAVGCTITKSDQQDATPGRVY